MGSSNIKKNCEYCRNAFEPSRYAGNRQRFCSEDCQRAWWLENREDAGKVYTYTCENCGKEYQTVHSNRDTCCSRECGFELRHKRALVVKDCPTCEQEFEATASGPDYCSDECYQVSLERDCVECGKHFIPENSNQLICSEACKLARGRRMYEEYMTEKIGDRTHVCGWCGKEFVASYGDKRRKFCSRKCQRKAYQEANPARIARWRAIDQRRRRARKYGNGRVDDIDPAIVFERDGWRCGICGKAVNPGLEFPHPMSPSLDHIIPLAQGGTHTWGNVQLAHHQCNSEKGDRDGGQLRLGLITEEANATV